jgi:hypothetical protein
MIKYWLHEKFNNLHFWEEYQTIGTIDKRYCTICGLVQWFDYITLEWFVPYDK